MERSLGRPRLCALHAVRHLLLDLLAARRAQLLVLARHLGPRLDRVAHALLVQARLLRRAGRRRRAGREGRGREVEGFGRRRAREREGLDDDGREVAVGRLERQLALDDRARVRVGVRVVVAVRVEAVELVVLVVAAALGICRRRYESSVGCRHGSAGRRSRKSQAGRELEEAR